MLRISIAYHSEPAEKRDHQGHNEGSRCHKVAYVAFMVDSFPKVVRVWTKELHVPFFGGFVNII